jgi:hypothetical protein
MQTVAIPARVQYERRAIGEGKRKLVLHIRFEVYGLVPPSYTLGDTTENSDTTKWEWESLLHVTEFNKDRQGSTLLIKTIKRQTQDAKKTTLTETFI